MAFTAEEFISLTEKTLLYLVIIDNKGEIFHTNKRCETLFQSPKKQVIGKSIFNYVIDEDKSGFKKVVSNLGKNEPILGRTFRFYSSTKSGILSLKFDFVCHDDLIYASGIDITEENKEHYALTSLSKLTKTGAWYFNPITEELFLSKECYRLLELKPDTPITIEEIINYYHPESRDRVKKHLDTLISSKTPFDYTERLITATGVQKWVRVLGEPTIHNDKVIFINASFSDITERQDYIEKLKYNEETKHLALKGIRSGLFDHNIETDHVFYSIDFKKMLGLPLNQEFVPEEVFRKMIHPDDIDEALERHAKNLNKEGYHYFNYYRLKHIDVGYRHYEVYGYRKKNKEGKTIRMIGNLIDVHQKKINERTIAENQSRLLAMVNNNCTYTILLNNKGEILMADEDSLKIIKRDFNIDPTITTSRFIDVIPVNFKNTFANEFNKALKGTEVKKEIERVTYQGAVQWLEGRYIPISDNNNNINSILVSFQDITELKSAEIAIKEAHLKEQELSTLKSNILSNFSHEIRTPLNGIMTISNLLLQGEEKPEERKRLLEYLEESKDRLLKTINNLSHYSEIDTIQNNLDYQELDMNYTVETCYREYRHLAKSKNLLYTLELDENCPSAYIDENLFQTALNNIIHNAIKYTDVGEIIVKIKAIEKKKCILVSIKDTGIGIENDNLEKIFDPFIQESFGLSRKYEGTGIGLSLSKKYIEVLGGKISIKSELNKGTEFIITIPHKL